MGAEAGVCAAADVWATAGAVFAAAGGTGSCLSCGVWRAGGAAAEVEVPEVEHLWVFGGWEWGGGTVDEEAEFVVLRMRSMGGLGYTLIFNELVMILDIDV